MANLSPSEDTPVWLTKGEAKKQAVIQMFSQIAPVYDLINKIVSLGLDQRWRKAAVEKIHIQTGESVLDLCCGTGAFLPLLLKKVGDTGRVYAIDLCLPMLEKAKERYKTKVLFDCADACNLPFANESFNAITVGWGIRNVTDMDLAHQEAFRILKPGGRFVSLDMAQPTQHIYKFLSKKLYPTLVPFIWSIAGFKQAGKYLPESTTLFYNREQITHSMQKVGFQEVQFQDFYCGNICMHWGVKR